MIEVSNLKKSFGKFSVLKGINLNLAQSSIVAVMGPNGSGKTTFLKCILGLVLPDSGTIKVKGTSIAHDFHYRQHIGYMPQIARYPENLKVKELIAMLKNLRQSEKILDEELLEEFKLSELYNKHLGTLSGGQKQRVGGSIAFLFNPDIVILDEPIAGLDPVSSEQMRNKIARERKKGKLIIITTHLMSETEDLADRLVYLLDGNIYLDDSIEGIKEKAGETKLNTALAKMIDNVSR